MHFTFGSADPRGAQADAIFAGLASIDDGEQIAGLIRARGDNKRTLSLAAMQVKGATSEDLGYYELDAALQLQRVEDAKTHAYVKQKTAIPRKVVTVDAASVLVVDDKSRRWRLPKTDAAYDVLTTQGLVRLDREVATERDVFSCHGTFYELPAENADGFAKIRPISTHRLRVMDYCSYRGLLIFTGLRADAAANAHILRSADGRAALWAGAIDDLWKLGKPAGQGGPWKDAAVNAGVVSDPYLFAGYDRKTLTLTADRAVTVRVEVDLTGESLWVPHRTFDVSPGKPHVHVFPRPFQARWLRVTASADCTATALLRYD